MTRGKAYRRHKARCRFERFRDNLYCSGEDWCEHSRWARKYFENFPARRYSIWSNSYLRKVFNHITKQEKLALINDQDRCGYEFVTKYHYIPKW